MNTIRDYYKQAELVFAAYGDLTIGTPRIADLTNSAVGMSATQAQRFAQRWRVVEQYNDSFSGLSATVVEEVAAPGRKHLAIRGTEFLDPRDHVSNAIVFIGYVMDAAPQYRALKSQVGEWLDNGTLSPGFTVAGHSLGGYLATGLAADYPAQVAHAYLYNAPVINGLLGIVTAPILQALGVNAPLDASRVSNLKADAGLSPIAGLGAQVAPVIPVPIENQFLSDVPNPPLTGNHSQRVLTDALAVHALYSALGPSLDTEQIGLILRASSNTNNRTLENALDALRRLLGFSGETASEERRRIVAANDCEFRRTA